VEEVQFSAVIEQVTQTLLQGWHTLATLLLMNCPSGQVAPQTVSPMCL
jgi:hypothetical protein